MEDGGEEERMRMNGNGGWGVDKRGRVKESNRERKKRQCSGREGERVRGRARWGKAKREDAKPII